MESEPRPADGIAAPGPTAGEVVRDLMCHPVQRLVYHWNWKSAILSSASRSSLFFTTNLAAGFDAAVAALVTEAVFRATTAGFYGAMTQSFRRVEPRWMGTLAAMGLLPAVQHSLELAVHLWRGTPELALSIGASIVFTACSTAFHLHAMRQGVFIVGSGRRSLGADFLALPGVVLSIVGLRREAGGRQPGRAGRALVAKT